MNYVIIDPPFPQLTKLATQLARDGKLSGYVHPFLLREGNLLSKASQIPGIGIRLAHELERRENKISVDPTAIHLAGTQFEIARYGLHHFQRVTGRNTVALQERAIYARNRRLSKEASRHLQSADVLVASYGTALEAFSKPSGQKVLKVLDYPSSYYRHSLEILRSEAKRRPDFASTLQGHQITTRLSKRIDIECQLADLILVGSEFVRSSFMNYGFEGSKIEVIPYGADLSLFDVDLNQTQPSEEFRVLFVGQIGQRKGIADIFDAYRSIRTNRSSLTLVGNFVGPTNAFDSNRDLFTHIPHISQSALKQIYLQSSVLVLPSYIEGMGLVVLEAMASGVPVVVSDRGPDQIVRDGIDGFVVKAGDSAALASKLEFLSVNPTSRLEMGRAAYQRARQFTWESHYQGLEKAVDRLL